MIRFSSFSFLFSLPLVRSLASVLLEINVRYYMNFFSQHCDNIPIMRGFLILCLVLLTYSVELPYQAHSFNDLDYFMQLLKKGKDHCQA